MLDAGQTKHTSTMPCNLAEGIPLTDKQENFLGTCTLGDNGPAVLLDWNDDALPGFIAALQQLPVGVNLPVGLLQTVPITSRYVC